MSKFFKTPKETELAILELQGKPYMQVPQRIVWFREEHPEWLFEVTFPIINDTLVMARAEIKDETGKLRAVAHKVEHYAHFKDALEKAETSAIGRALAMIGYGTQFAPDIYEDDRLADSPTSNSKPSGQSRPPQKQTQPGPAKHQSTPKPAVPGQDVGEYVVQCGKKFKGMTLNQMGYDEVSGYMDYFIQSQQKENKPFNPAVAEFVSKAEEFLSQGATGTSFGPPPEPQEAFDQIPF